MKKIAILIFGLFILIGKSFGQDQQGKIIYIIDSLPVIEDPTPDNNIVGTDISDITVVKNKDSLKILGYQDFDGVIFIFTKEYRNRPENLKSIPSTHQMERKNGVWLLKGKPYSGDFKDYYYSGRKEGEGQFKDGKIDGLRKTFFQNGKVSMERNYTNGIKNGIEKEYFEDGSLKQKGEFVNGKEEGIWEMYFPNGQVRQSSTFKNGKMDGETTVYYSSGKILAVEISKNGTSFPDKRLEKINKIMQKGHNSNKDGDYKRAIKFYSDAIKIDSSYAEAYFSRGTAKLNDFRFDDAIGDFDKALLIEPFYKEALANRAFTRIRKYQFSGSRKLSESNGITVMASKDNPEIPESELALICQDLRQAIFLGDKTNMILDAVATFCEKQSNH